MTEETSKNPYFSRVWPSLAEVLEKGLRSASLAIPLFALAVLGMSKSAFEVLDLLPKTVSEAPDAHQAVIRLARAQQDDRNELQALRKVITDLDPADRSAIRIGAVEQRLNNLADRQARLERVILNSPEKALSLPMLRRDIDNIRDSNAAVISSVKATVDQVYDLTKWLLGALSLGVLSLAAAPLISKLPG